MRIIRRLCVVIVVLMLCAACGGSSGPAGKHQAPQDGDDPVAQHCTADAHEIPGTRTAYRQDLHTPQLGELVLYRSAKCRAAWAEFKNVTRKAFVSVTVTLGESKASQSSGMQSAFRGQPVFSPILIVSPGQSVSGLATLSGQRTVCTRHQDC